jgi:hypothetical protein
MRPIPLISHSRECSSFSALFALLLVIFFAKTAPCLAQTSLGTNLDAVTDYSPQVPFRDIFLTSREWITQCEAGIDPGCSGDSAFDTGEAHMLDRDSSGWVKSLPARSAAPIFTRVATIWDIAPEFPEGRYVVLYSGTGTLEYGLGATKSTTLSRPGRDIVEVKPSKGPILLRITETDPLGTGNYIRDIHVVSESDESTFREQRFNESFIKRLEPYSVLRFMDWLRTNNSALSTWQDRPKINDARYSTERGVPPEIAIELANFTSKSPWFNIPHLATDQYIEELARLTLSSLRSELTVYIEYSNEAWNSTFSQGNWIEQQGEALFSSSAESPFTKRINFYGKRSAEVCAIWRSVFNQSADRINCVMASQAANSWTASEALSCPLWNQGPCVNYGIRSLAIAPYFGDYLGQEENLNSLLRLGASTESRLTSIFKELMSGDDLKNGPSGGALAQSFEWIDRNREVANQNNIDLISYEGGQHLVGIGSAAENEKVSELFTAANRDNRMREVYINYLNGWRSRSNSLFTHFSDISIYSKFGSWGALETTVQTSSPKYDALFEYATGRTSRSTPSGTKKTTLSIRVTGGGTINSRPSGISCGKRCAARFNRGTIVILSFKPSKGYRFSRWSGACGGNKRECRVRLNKSTLVGANFIRTR